MSKSPRLPTDETSISGDYSCLLVVGLSLRALLGDIKSVIFLLDLIISCLCLVLDVNF